jgi:hypothetical protein
MMSRGAHEAVAGELKVMGILRVWVHHRGKRVGRILQAKVNNATSKCAAIDLGSVDLDDSHTLGVSYLSGPTLTAIGGHRRGDR